MERWTRHELLQELDRLGYKIDEKNCFTYTNNMNGKSYPARAIYIVEKDSGLCFANIYARRDANFDALQDIRYRVEVINNGKVWEL